jgi:K+:H+ antiporter
VSVYAKRCGTSETRLGAHTRALMELIVLNIGKTDIFSMLVIMALVSTFMATPLIRWLMKGQASRATLLGEPSPARAMT